MSSPQQIRLNFFPVSPNGFTFDVWRRELTSGTIRRSEDDLYQTSLPRAAKVDERSTYQVSLVPRQGFEEYRCHSSFNVWLTQRVLFHHLTQAVSEAIPATEYELGRSFSRRLYLVLRRYPEGRQCVWIEPHYFQPTGEVGFLVDFAFLKNPDISFSRDVQRLSLSLDQDFRSNRNFYIDRYQKVLEGLEKLRGRVFPITIPRTGHAINIATSPTEREIRHLSPKRYVFASGGQNASPFRGLRDFGPLEPVPAKTILIFISTLRDQSLQRDLETALLGKSPGALFEGLERVFGVQVTSTEGMLLPSLAPSDLAPALQQVVNRSERSEHSLVMPILIADRQLEQSYYHAKYSLLQHSLPLQVVTTQLLRRRDGLKWSASNIALQIFSKLGGKAWKVVPTDERTIIIGIGQAHHIVNGAVRRFFAYSICTDSSGLYRQLDVLGKSEQEGDYLRQLRDNIIAVVQQYIDQGYDRLVLHVPFKIRYKELEELREGVQEVGRANGRSDKTVVVLKVNTRHKFFGYAHTNSLVPFEGSFTQVGNRPKGYLVWFDGLQRGGGAISRRPQIPTHIEFHWTSRPLDDQESTQCLQDALNLSGANFRGFNAASLPISIYYCQLVARFLARFPEEIEALDKLSNPWFL
jgi:hypothetical protein